jgi:EAL domain-containing protein (putative c-di-GMP-specific phosphodiesterase class I)
MICLLIRNQKLRSDLVQLLKNAGISSSAFDPDSDLAINALYGDNISLAIVEPTVANLKVNAWLDALGSLGARIPVYVLAGKRSEEYEFSSRNNDFLGWIDNHNAEHIFNLLTNAIPLAELTGSETGRKIEFYTAPAALQKLNTDKAMSILKIDATAFRKVSLEYGNEAYQALHACFVKIVSSLWGKVDCLRHSDLILRKSSSSCVFYVLLEQSRVARSVPAPGVLEMIADRIGIKLQEALWIELSKPRSERTLPSCLTVVPDFAVGHSTVLYNPCIDTLDTLDQLFSVAHESSKIQQKRVNFREIEVMQSIIKSDEILVPHYQAIFHLPTLTKASVEAVIASKSIEPITSSLYGFESLIRPQAALIQDKITNNYLIHLDSKVLRPDVLFALAKHCKLSLELDQACLEFGIRKGVALPGKLLLNILPRNLIHLDRLKALVSLRSDIVFEISESEGISNPEQMHKTRQMILELGAKLAADDFGKGQASIERVIKLRPDIIKIDRMLLENIHLDPIKRVFVEGIVHAAKMINSLVLAEGIEKWEEAEVVQKLGIELIQGFLLHCPQSLEQIQAQLDAAHFRITAA